VPEVRFEEFSEEWQESKLSDIVKLFGGNAFSSSDSSSFGVPWLKIANVGINGIDWSTPSYLPDEFWTGYKDYRLYKGDYVMALTRPILNHVLKISIVDKEALLNQRVAKLIFSTNAEYGYQLLQRKSIVDKIENELAGTDPPNLGSGNLKNINISTTLNKDEQSKIGNFFKRLDNIITFHQQELTTLKKTKQGFLQKMFPKEGESLPEVRFPGFTEGWEQRKLSDIAVFNPKSVLPEQFEYVDLESVLGTELISHRTEHRESAPSRAQRLAKQGDVFFQTVRPYQKNNYLFDLPYDNYVFSTGYAQMRPNIDSYFLFSRLQEEKFVSNVLDRCTGTSYPAINSNDLAQIEVGIPTLGEEQTKIGRFFKQLDNTINLHQRELDALKETKKAFLQKMFV